SPVARGDAVFCRSRKPARPSGELVKQRLRILQIGGIEPLDEPPVERLNQLASLPVFTPLGPQPRKAGRGAQFPYLGLLLMGDCNSLVKLDFRLIAAFDFDQEFT